MVVGGRASRNARELVLRDSLLRFCIHVDAVLTFFLRSKGLPPIVQVIATETEEADKVKSVVSLEEAAASKEAAGVKAIKVPDYSSCTRTCPHQPLDRPVH